MSFSSFSKEFTSNMFTSVENQFITKYLPLAEGDAVRVYLYGLYLCSCKEQFDGESAAKLLRISYETLVKIYGFWEECDLVRVLSRDPLLVEYLPVNAAVGKPKSIRPEKYAEFNRVLLRQLQKAGRDFKPFEHQRILEFLENTPMEPQAFLLVSEYCAKKDGEKLSCAHILNKAKKLADDYKYTYEQVERELADFNTREKTLVKLFGLLGIYRKPQDADYELLQSWEKLGMEESAIVECAKALKKGTPAVLDALVKELAEHDVHTLSEAKDYLARREELASAVFAVARKLGVKLQNPRTYIEEYAEKWLERGYDVESLSLVASFSFKLRYGFSEMDGLLDSLYMAGIVDRESVAKYCSAREKQLRLLQSVQAACGVVKKSLSALDMVAAWQSWNFGEEMILEAARRSAGASSPLTYMNKLLSEWKRTGISSPKDIPEKPSVQPVKHDFRSEAAIAADMRTDREHYYAVSRQRAISAAEQAKERAERDEEYRAADSAVKKNEIELARAEIYSPDRVPALSELIESGKKARKNALRRLALTEEDLLPHYTCAKCSDTGFLPDGRACDCYPG